MVLERFSKKTLLAVLLCFVALVGGVGAYVYIVNNQTSVELVRMDASNGLILEVDKTVYELGENVTITFTNNSNESVAFPDYGWATIRDSEGDHIAPGGVAMAVLRVPAGESLTWVWDQRDALYKQVPLGLYTVNVTVRSADLSVRLADLSVSFKIVD